MSSLYKGSKEEKSSNSIVNSLDYIIENSIKNLVNTAMLVRVESVDTKAKRLSCSLLVSQYDASGQVLEAGKLYDIPYMIYQGGKVAIICDPCVNDIGLAIFAQQDISLVQSAKSVQPASFRSYDMADGLYLGGFLNNSPEIFIELGQEGNVHIQCEEKIVLKSSQVAIEAEKIDIEGNLNIKGSLHLSEDVQAGSTSLINHVHGNVQSGASITGKAI